MSKGKILRIIGLSSAMLALGILLKLLVFKGTTQKLVADCQDVQSQCEQKLVVVLHGLVRSSASMGKMSQALHDSGYTVCNVQYPSRKHSVAKLATDFVHPAINKCFATSGKSINQPVNFVTHSLGGIVVRQLAQSTKLKIKRVVMLSPPNHGSELVDKLKIIPLFKFINGEAGLSIGTQADSVPNTLGQVPFATGIIVGNKSFNPIYSALIPGADDGKVSVASAKVAAMQDFLLVPYSHSFIMNQDVVIMQTLNFLEYGEFRANQQTGS